MGGKSKSKQSTTNTSSNTNIVNDGQFAGANGVTIDESDHSIEDSNNTDNSIRLEDSGNTDNSVHTDYDDSFNTDNSVVNEYEDSFNTDNSVHTDYEYDDSFNTDNSIANDGDYAGNNGTINITDGGAVEHAFGFGEEALEEVQIVASKALDKSAEQAINYGNNVEAILKSNQSTQQRILADAAKASTQDRELITKLAQSTSLAGQDIVAQSSQKMTLYMSAALALGFVAIVFFGRRN